MEAKKSIIFFERFSASIVKLTGSWVSFIFAALTIIIWAITGPYFHYSNTWQLVINTGTTIITFLMVFVIQHAQNKDTMAVQLKLDELIAATKGASNKVLNIEDLTDEQLKMLKHFYSQLSEISAKDKDPGKHHSIDETIKKVDNQDII